MPASEAALVIRPACLRDVEAIFRIHRRSLEGLDEEDFGWFKAMLSVRSRRRKVLVAEVGGEVAGFVIAYKRRSQAYVDSLAVDPAFRDKGIGGRLLEDLESVLKSEGVERVALSVKEGNFRALDFYLRRGYSVLGVILIMSAEPAKLPESLPNGYALKLKRASVLGRLRSFKPTTWWSTLTEPVDRMVYKRYQGGEEVLLAYRGKRVRGLAEFTADDELLVDYMAISSYSSLEALRALLHGLRSVSVEKGSERVVIPVDASKEVIVEELYRSGFRTHRTEYLLAKDLEED
ncbi:MAG: GNAT family N-acetyltransferase [Thermofilum sp.]